jgi:hypothetical protein
MMSRGGGRKKPWIMSAVTKENMTSAALKNDAVSKEENVYSDVQLKLTDVNVLTPTGIFSRMALHHLVRH